MKLLQNYYFLIYHIFFSYSLLLCMEDVSLQQSFQGITSLQKKCCAVVAQYETDTIKKIIKKLVLPPANLSYIVDQISVTQSTEDCISIFNVLPPTMYAHIGLTLLCNGENRRKEDTKKMLEFLEHHKDISTEHQRIVSFFYSYLDITDEKNITKEKIFQRSLMYKQTPLFVSNFLLQEGAKLSEYPIEEFLENRIEDEYRMQQPEFITQLLQREDIQAMCKKSIEEINQVLPRNQKCDDETVKYGCAYGVYNRFSLNALEKLIELGFVLKKEGFIPARFQAHNRHDQISVFEFVVQSIEDWKKNYALRNSAYAKYMLTVWDTPVNHAANVMYHEAITNFYAHNDQEIDFLESLADDDYKKNLNAFLTIKHHFFVFGNRALERLKQFYTEDLKLLKNKVIRNK